MITFLKTIFCFLIITYFSNCQNSLFYCSGTSPAHLVDSFYSYQTIGSFEKIVKRTYDTIIVFENTKLSDTDKRPPFSIYTILIPEFKHLGFSGQLRASFLNDRLRSIWFYPDNIDGYLKKLDSDLNLNLTTDKEINIDCVEVIKETDFKDDIYFGWTDIRLQKEVDDWISRYA